MISRVDIVQGFRHHSEMEMMLMVKSEKHSRVFFRNERARFWADNIIDIDGVSCTVHVARLSVRDDKNYLILHPDDDEKDVPFDYDGTVIRYKVDETGANFSN